MESVKDLLAQRAAIDKKIQTAQRAQKHDAIGQIRELMAAHGLVVSDLSARAAGTVAAPKRTNAGKKVAAKYRHPKSGETWSGRGLQPKWLRAELAAGKKLADFTV